MLFHYLLLEMHFKRRDYAQVLIRVTSVANYVMNCYLKRNYQQFVNRNNRKKISLPKGQKEAFAKYYFDKEEHPIDYNRDLTLVAGLRFLEYQKDTVLVESLRQVEQIRKLRNRVSHDLDELRLQENWEAPTEIVVAVKALKQMIAVMYPQIKASDYQYFANLNQRMKELL
ncbi:MAG: hypothetical protein ACK5MW_02495 [Enterococcus sp.]